MTLSGFLNGLSQSWYSRDAIASQAVAASWTSVGISLALIMKSLKEASSATQKHSFESILTGCS